MPDWNQTLMASPTPVSGASGSRLADYGRGAVGPDVPVQPPRLFSGIGLDPGQSVARPDTRDDDPSPRTIPPLDLSETIAKLKSAKSPEEKKAVRQAALDAVNSRGETIEKEVEDKMRKLQISPESSKAAGGRLSELMAEMSSNREQREQFRSAAQYMIENPGMKASDMRNMMEGFRPAIRAMVGHSVLDTLDVQLDAEERKEMDKGGAAGLARSSQRSRFGVWGITPSMGTGAEAWTNAIRETSSAKPLLNSATSSAAKGSKSNLHAGDRSLLTERLRQQRLFANYKGFEAEVANLAEEDKMHPEIALQLGWNYFLQGYIEKAYEVVDSSYDQWSSPWPSPAARDALLLARSFFDLLARCQTQAALDVAVSIQRIDAEVPVDGRLSAAEVAVNYFHHKILSIAVYEGLVDSEYLAPLIRGRLQRVLQASIEANQLHDTVTFSVMLADELASTEDKEDVLRRVLNNPSITPICEAELSLQLGGVLAESEDGSQSSALSSRAEELFEQLSCQVGVERVRLMRLSTARSKTASAYKSMRQLAHAFEKLGSPSLQYSALSDALRAAVKLAYSVLGDEENGLKYARMAVQEFKKGCMYELISDATTALAVAMGSGAADTSAAIKLLEESLVLDQQRGYLEGEENKYGALVKLEGQMALLDDGAKHVHEERQKHWMVRWDSAKIGVSDNAVLRRAKMCLSTKQWERADALSGEALERFTRSGDTVGISECHRNLFESRYWSFGARSGITASDVLEQARVAFSAYKQLGEENIPAEFIIEIALAFEKLAPYFSGKEREIYYEAIYYLRVSQTICDHIRMDLSASSDLGSLQQKQLLGGSFCYRQIRSQALRIAMTLGDGKEVWKWTQTGKARAVSDMLTSQLVSVIRLLPELVGDRDAVEILGEEARLLKDLHGANGAARLIIQSSLNRLRQKMEGHSALSYLMASRAGVSKLRDLEGIFNSDAAKRLAKSSNIVLVDWVFIDETIVMLTVDASLVPRLTRLNITLTKLRKWNRTQLPSSVPAATLEEREQLEELRPHQSKLVEMAGLVSELRHRTSKGDLVVLCPSEALHAVPLHALEVEAGVELIRRNPVVYTSSLSLFAQSCARADARRDRQRALRATVFTAYEDRTTKNPKGREKLYQAMRKLAGDFGTNAIVGVDANRSNLLERLRDATDIVHYHGHMDWHPNVLQQSLRLDPAQPLIRGGTEPNGVGPDCENAPFTVRDMFTVRIDASLACVMSCSSGIQAIAPGDEPLGLLTALQLAGCASVVGTLWPTKTEEALQFAHHFYRALRRQHQKEGWVNLAACFQKTVLKMKASKREFEDPEAPPVIPNHWAPFVLHGAWFL
ncbi:CHAT domain-containing protein [Cladorrhinum sp. PSN332]|nr:CHAT domain-containing protein [Cladorrhinum sp. PSN332]